MLETIFTNSPQRKIIGYTTFCAQIETNKSSHIRLFNKLPESAWTVGMKNLRNTLDDWF